VELYIYCPNTSSWRGAQLKRTGKALPLPLSLLHDALMFRRLRYCSVVMNSGPSIKWQGAILGHSMSTDFEERRETTGTSVTIVIFLTEVQ